VIGIPGTLIVPGAITDLWWPLTSASAAPCGHVWRTADAGCIIAAMHPRKVCSSLIFENFDYGFKRAALLEAHQQNTIYLYLEICYSYADANSCGGRHEARIIYQKVVSMYTS